MWSASIVEKEYDGSQADIDSYIGGLQTTRGVSLTQVLARDSRDRAEFTTRGSKFQVETTYSGG